MNNFTMFLGFVLAIHSMNMLFPERGKKSTQCLIQLVGALFISKAFQAMIAFFNRKKQKKNNLK